MSIEARVKEADLYLSQGLTEEACQIYQEVLAELGSAEHPLKAHVKERLSSLDDVDSSVAYHSHEVEGEAGDYIRRKFENCLGLIEAGFHKEAIVELEELLEAEFQPGVIHAKLGECYLTVDQPFAAAEHFEKALEGNEFSVQERLDILYQLAVTREKIGAVAQAIEALREIQKIDPSFRDASDKIEQLTTTERKFGPFYTLVVEGHLSEEQLDRAREMARESKKSIESILLEQFGVDKMDMGRSLSNYYKVPFVYFNDLEVGKTPNCIKGIKEHFFRSNVCVPISEEGGIIKVAIDNPNDLIKLDNIRRVLQTGDLQICVALKEDIDNFIDYFYGKYTVSDGDEDVFDQLEIVEEEEDEEDDVTAADVDNVVVQLANKIIDDAYQRNASDIHIESLTGKRGCQVRFRIDGECMRYQSVPYNYKKALVSRIKIMSGLDIAEKRLPQDGKIKFKTRTGKVLELRVATLPTIEGNEDVVMRLLASSSAMPLDKIGLLENNLVRFKRLLEMPYGLIFVVGPTGSGKTTTLHAALGYINRPEKKIWTAEDPVEIVQEGLRQVQVKPDIGLTFARILRAFLRADPDVIMVGETRDEETAHTVIEASLTGHLVFSTLHTNSAPETVTRLLGMGMDPYNFADALLGVLAQRLVKRLCPKCKESYIASNEEMDELRFEYGDHPKLPFDELVKGPVTLYRGKGCSLCHNTGYKGRMAIHELLVNDDVMRDLIQGRRPVSEIEQAAKKEGMFTLKQDGIQKVLMGETDIKQVRAACIK